MNGKAVIINFYSRKYGYSSYLEIGGQPEAGQRSTWAQIELKTKDTIDPNVTVSKSNMVKDCEHFTMTSDEFFEKYKDEKKYDVIFIDGLHTHDQVARDIEGSLACLADDGTIILHDMLPPSRSLESDDRTGKGWRAFADLRVSREDLTMFCIPPPWGTEDGLGIIRRGKQELFDKKIEYSYDFFVENKVELMQIKTLKDFFEIHESEYDITHLVRLLHFDAARYLVDFPECKEEYETLPKRSTTTGLNDFTYLHWEKTKDENYFYVIDSHEEFQSRLGRILRSDDFKRMTTRKLEKNPDIFKDSYNLFSTLRNKINFESGVKHKKFKECMKRFEENGVYKYEKMFSEEQLQELQHFQDSITGALTENFTEPNLKGGYVDINVQPNGEAHVSLKRESPDTGLLRLQSKSMGFFHPGLEDILKDETLLAIYRTWYKNHNVEISRATMDWLLPARINHNGWHCDILSNQLKAMILLSDVDLDSGPMYYANGSHLISNDFEQKMKHATFIHGVSEPYCLGRRYGMNVCTWNGGNVTYPSDDVVDNQPLELDYEPITIDGQTYEKTVATGKAGDVIFFEASGYHSGNICHEDNIRRDIVLSCPTESSFIGKFYEFIGKKY
jgi:hypothetical protein